MSSNRETFTDIHMLIYGEPSYAMLKTLCIGATYVMLFISETTEKRVLSSFSSRTVFCNVVYGFDNEVLIDVTKTDLESKEQVISYFREEAEKLLTKIEDTFHEDERFYLIPIVLRENSLASMPNKDFVVMFKSMLDHRENLSKFAQSYWPYCWFGANPLTVRDFKNVVEELNNPTMKFAELNPFQQEKRKVELKELLSLVEKLDIRLFPLLEWLSNSKPDRANFVKLSEDMWLTLDAFFFRKVVAMPEFDKLVELVNRLREEKDWIDPIMMIRNEKAYRRLIG